MTQRPLHDSIYRRYGSMSRTAPDLSRRIIMRVMRMMPGDLLARSAPALRPTFEAFIHRYPTRTRPAPARRIRTVPAAVPSNPIIEETGLPVFDDEPPAASQPPDGEPLLQLIPAAEPTGPIDLDSLARSADMPASVPPTVQFGPPIIQRKRVVSAPSDEALTAPFSSPSFPAPSTRGTARLGEPPEDAQSPDAPVKQAVRPLRVQRKPSSGEAALEMTRAAPVVALLEGRQHAGFTITPHLDEAVLSPATPESPEPSGVSMTQAARSVRIQPDSALEQERAQEEAAAGIMSHDERPPAAALAQTPFVRADYAPPAENAPPAGAAAESARPVLARAVVQRKQVSETDDSRAAARELSPSVVDVPMSNGGEPVIRSQVASSINGVLGQGSTTIRPRPVAPETEAFNAFSGHSSEIPARAAGRSGLTVAAPVLRKVEPGTTPLIWRKPLQDERRVDEPTAPPAAGEALVLTHPVSVERSTLIQREGENPDAPPADVPPAAPPKAAEAAAPDMDELVERILRRLLRQLAVESERRGLNG